MIYFKILAKNIIIYAFCNKLSLFVYNVTYYENGGMWMSVEQEVLSKNEGRKEEVFKAEYFRHCNSK